MLLLLLMLLLLRVRVPRSGEIRSQLLGYQVLENCVQDLVHKEDSEQDGWHCRRSGEKLGNKAGNGGAK